MMQVMLHHVPDDPGTRQIDLFAVPVIREGLSHVVGTPASQTSGHALPGVVEGLHHLGGRGGGRASLIQTCVRFHVDSTVFAQELREPTGTAAYDVQYILTDGT